MLTTCAAPSSSRTTPSLLFWVPLVISQRRRLFPLSLDWYANDYLPATWTSANHLQYRNKFLPKDIKIVGYARTKMDHPEYLKRVKSYIKTPTKEVEDQLNEFTKLCTYVAGQYDKDESFEELNKHLEEFEQGRKEAHRVFYMALPPSVFIPVSQHLKKCCYPKNGIARVIVRKSLFIAPSFH